MSRIAPPRSLLISAAAGLALLAAPLASAAKPKSHALNASGQLLRIAKPGRFQSVQRGTITGVPFGSGRMLLRSTLKQARVTSTFTLTTKLGNVSGTATARLTLDGDTANYKGTARIVSGTGRYRHALGSNIAFTGVGPVSAKSTRITLRGRVNY